MASTAGELIAKVTLNGIAGVEKGLNGLSNSMKGAEKNLKSVGDGLKSVGDGFRSAGEAIAPLSVGVGALAGLSLDASNEINDAFGNLKAGLGLTDAELAQLEGTIVNVASTGVGEFDEVSQAVQTVSQNMSDLKPDEIEGITFQAMQLANALGVDVSEVTRSAGTLMGQFGTDGQQALDLIGKGYQSNLDFSGEFLDSLNEYSVHFDALGLTAEDMFNIMIKGSEEGAWNLDKIGDAIKEGNIRMKDLSKGSGEAFQTLGLDAETMFNDFASGGDKAKLAFMTTMGALSELEDDTERNAVGVQLFGTMYEDLEAGVVSSFGNISDELGDYSGTAQQIAEDSQTFGQKMTGAWNEVQYALKPLGDVIQEVALQALPPLIEKVKQVSNWFSNLSPESQKLAVVLGAVGAVLPVILIGLGGLLAIAGSAVTAIGTLVGVAGKLVGAFTSVGKVGGAFKKLAGMAKSAVTRIGSILGGLRGFVVKIVKGILTVLKTNPWIALVTTLISVGIMIYQNWDQIVTSTKEIWAGLKSWFSSFWAQVKIIFSGFVTFVTTKWNDIVTSATTIFNTVKTVISDALNGAKEIVATAITAIVTGFLRIKMRAQIIMASVRLIFFTVSQAIKTVFSTVVEFFSTSLQNIKTFFTNTFNSIKSIVMLVINTIKNIIGTLVLKAQSVLLSVKTAFVNGFNLIKQVVSTAITAVVGFLVNMYNRANQIVQQVKSAFSIAFDAVRNKVNQIINTIINYFVKWYNNAQNILANVRSAFSTAFNAVRNIVSNVINALVGFFQNLYSKAQSIVQNIRSAFSSAFNAISSIVSGIIETIKGILQGLYEKASSVVESIKSTFSSGFEAVKSTVSGAVENVKSLISGIWDTASGIIDKIKSGFSNIFTGIKIPKFNLGGWTMGDLPALPNIGVSWHASGGILDSATMIGAGEAGAEAIVPLSSQRKMKPFAQAVSRFMMDDDDRKEQNANNPTVVSVQVDGREIANATAEHMDNNLRNRTDSRRRSRGGKV